LVRFVVRFSQGHRERRESDGQAHDVYVGRPNDDRRRPVGLLRDRGGNSATPATNADGGAVGFEELSGNHTDGTELLISHVEAFQPDPTNHRSCPAAR
jgi:hypothetical protein